MTKKDKEDNDIQKFGYILWNKNGRKKTINISVSASGYCSVGRTL